MVVVVVAAAVVQISFSLSCHLSTIMNPLTQTMFSSLVNTHVLQHTRKIWLECWLHRCASNSRRTISALCTTSHRTSTAHTSTTGYYEFIGVCYVQRLCHLESRLLWTFISSMACVSHIERLCHPRIIQSQRSTPAIRHWSFHFFGNFGTSLLILMLPKLSHSSWNLCARSNCLNIHEGVEVKGWMIEWWTSSDQMGCQG